MKIERINNAQPFTGPLDGALTQTLATIDSNPMVNATLLDVFSMVLPRTYVDTKKRNKYAGMETFFREITGTFIVCLSSGIIAKAISYLYNKFVNPQIKINPNSWISDKTLKLLDNAWKNGKESKKYVDTVLSNILGKDGGNNNSFDFIQWKDVDWYDNKKWKNYKWKDSKFENIQDKLKDKKSIVQILSDIVENDTNKTDAKQVLNIVEHRIGNALGVTNAISVKFGENNLETSLHNLLRDIYDAGKHIFNSSTDSVATIAKLKKLNRIRTFGALSVASLLGLTNQYINRKITKKRTGSDAFVGNVNYKNDLKKKNHTEKSSKVKFNVLKFLSSAGIILLATKVMNIKNLKDFADKLEFTSVITGGNAIKTVYTATLVGRFLAAKDKTELRESVTRDYFGFLNWLVFGGFVAKGVANLLDKKRDNLFNISNTDKSGLTHWLNDLSLKSHSEIAAKGKTFAKNNIWKLNLAHISGLAYSTLALGVVVPLINILVTKNKYKKKLKATNIKICNN